MKRKIWLDEETDVSVEQIKMCLEFEGNSKTEEKEMSVVVAEQTGVRFLFIPDCCGVKRILFSPCESGYILGRILSAVDDKENEVICDPINTQSYKGMDVFLSRHPRYAVDVPRESKSLSIFFYYEKIARKHGQLIHELIENDRAGNKFVKEEELFRQTAIDELIKEKIVQIPVQTSSCSVKSMEENYYQEYQLFKEKYDGIMNSTCWKITKPLRNLMDIVKNNPKGDGIKRGKEGLNAEISCAKEIPWIGVHLHLYYRDLLDEFCGYLNNITQPFDLYISCREGENQGSILQVAKLIRNVRQIVIKETMNRGRDIAPFYVLFCKELQQYECLLHIHSKKSLYTGEEKAEWRHWALEGVLKNEKMVAETLHYLKNAEPQAGLVYGEMTPTLPLMALHWLRNAGKGRELSERLNIKFDDGMFMYPVGSFFWARTEAIKPLFDLNFTYEDFDEEQGQIDATLAHALERIISCLVKQRGYRTYIFDPEKEVFAVDKSYKSFQTYFSYTVKNVGDLLLNFDLVSFDIFDTLITRLVYKPDDVFRMMERLIYSRWNKKVDFLAFRKQAEYTACLQSGDYCNIHNIYACLPEVSVFTEEEALQLKEWEIQLELELCIPREDSKEILKKLVNAGKKVVLVSDMYLTREIIEKMLRKCGYEGYEDVWISCEKGLRKDRDTMWEEFFRVYGEYKTIHIGDNPHSDCQLVGDRRRINMLWLSPREQFRFSDQYEKFKRFIDTSVENSITLGIMVNQCFYNSPFALKDGGVALVNTVAMAAEGIFAPLFLRFSQFIKETCTEDRVLLFLAREGYFLQKLYKIFCQSFGEKEYENFYFLTSRRAASVGQIREYQDARELLNTSYEGKTSTFLRERFGIENICLDKDEKLKIPGDERKVIALLATMAGPILKRSEYERGAYLKYFDELLGETPDWERITLVDVGYAGTIQYYLMKMLKKTLDGRYLATEYKVKPLKLGGECKSLYSFKTSKIFEYTQLFLEAVTAAPYGQLMYFEKENDQILPVYKKEGETCWRSAQKLQKSIYQYVELVGKLTNEIGPHFNEELAETILSEVLRKDIFSEELKGIFTVYDGYCMDGEWIYDEKETRWKLVHEADKE